MHFEKKENPLKAAAPVRKKTPLLFTIVTGIPFLIVEKLWNLRLFPHNKIQNQTIDATPGFGYGKRQLISANRGYTGMKCCQSYFNTASQESGNYLFIGSQKETFYSPLRNLANFSAMDTDDRSGVYFITIAINNKNR